MAGSRNEENQVGFDVKKLDDALDLLAAVVEREDPTNIYGCFSGGHDSLVATHVASRHPRFSGAFHANTGIGIAQTREFVRKTCSEQDWELEEYHPEPGETYDDLVLDMGFPRGPKSHNTMMFYLKKKQIQRLVREKKEGWYDRVGLVTGIRRQESNRRMNADMAVSMSRHGAQLWINPILNWTATDCTQYIEWAGLDRNPVVDHLHRSGECLCGAFADPTEIWEIEALYPEAAKRIHDLEEKASEKGLVDCKWAVSQAPGKTWDEVDADEVDAQLCMDCVRRITPEPPSDT